MSDELANIDKPTGTTALVDPRTMKPRGFENFEQDDLILPRIAIGQAMSKPVQDGEVRNGALYSTLTKESFVDNEGKPYLEFIVVRFDKSRRLWDKDNKDNSLCMSVDGRKNQGGKICESECPHLRTVVAKDPGINTAATAFDWSEDSKGNRLSPACTLYYNYLSITAPFKSAFPSSLSLGRTSAKVAKQFNSFIMATGEDIFARIYALTTERKENTKGTFFVYKIRPVRQPNREEYALAEAMASRMATTKYTIHEEGIEKDEKDDEVPF